MSRKIDLGDGRWRLIIEAGKDAYGKRDRQTHTFEGTSKQADKEIKRLESEVAAGKKFEASQKPLGEYLLHWIDNIAQPDLASNTYDSYRWEIIKHIIPIMGHIPLASLGPVHIQEFYSFKSKAGSIRKPAKSELVPKPKGLSNRSVSYLHSILNQALEKAVDLELLEKNPCKKIKPPKDKTTKKAQKLYVLDIKQLQEFLAFAINHRDYALIHTAAYTGARQSELLGLHWAGVIWDTNMIAIAYALHMKEGETGVYDLGDTKNATSTRVITVSAEVVNVLRAHKAKLEQDGVKCDLTDLVFPDTDGGYMNRKNLSNRFSNLASNAGREGFTFHGLRHTHATILLSNGEFINAVSERLGHANVDTTLRTYGHVLPRKRSEVADRFSSLLKTKNSTTGHKNGTPEV